MAPNRKRRNTPQRATVLAALRETKEHPTAAELYAAVRERLPRISLGTVYRNLEVLRADGLIRKIEYGAADARYDACLDPHDHVRCHRCGAVRDVEMPARPAVPLPAAAAGFAIEGYRLEYFGVCPACNGHDAQDT